MLRHDHPTPSFLRAAMALNGSVHCGVPPSFINYRYLEKLVSNQIIKFQYVFAYGLWSINHFFRPSIY